MTATFEKDTEAFLSVLALVVGADQAGSLEERDFRFKQVKGVAIFGNPGTAEFSKLLGEVTDSVYSSVPQKDGEFTAAGIDSLLVEVKKTLNADLRSQLVQISAALVDTDGADARESALLAQIRRALA
jgi:hypothetical protein